MAMNTTIRQSYITLRGINLGVAFVREHRLQHGQRYAMSVEGMPDRELIGTLDRSGFIGGLSAMYKVFDLTEGDNLEVNYDGAVIHITPPADRRIRQEEEPGEGVAPSDARPVFERQNLRHIHIEPYAPGNLSNWIPQTEADVYMVFGALSEYTDYRYGCGASQALLNNLGYQARTKPDAFLIQRATGQYVIAEFKMNSNEFRSNHAKEDVDVLVCWEDNEAVRSVLPPEVLCLKTLLRRAVEDGDIDL